MLKRKIILIIVFATSITSTLTIKGQAYQPLENQRLSTSNNVLFSSGNFSGTVSVPLLSIGVDGIPIQETNYGYNGAAYKVLRLGSSLANRSIALNIDPSTVTGGTFNGTGEILIGSGAILTPNNAGTDWMPVIRASGGKIYLGGTSHVSTDGLIVNGTAISMNELTASTGNFSGVLNSGKHTINGLNGIPLIQGEMSSLPVLQTAAYIGVSTSLFPTGNNGDLVLMPRSSAENNIIFYTGTGTPVERLRLNSTTSAFSGAISASSGNFTSYVTSNDIHTGRNATQGYVYYGTNLSNFSGFDGTYFTFNAGANISGSLTTTGNSIFGLTNPNGLVNIYASDVGAKGTYIKKGPYNYESQDAAGSWYHSWGSRFDAITSSFVRTYTSSPNNLPFIKLSTGNTIDFGGSSSNSISDLSPVMATYFSINANTGNVNAAGTFSSTNVRIGQIDPLKATNYLLAVNGNALFTKVTVMQSANWPDFVFDDNYKTPNPQELKKFIKANHHLPEIPAAKEIEQNGIDLGNNQALLLKKIEELTLMIIEQDEKIQNLQSLIIKK